MHTLQAPTEKNHTCSVLSPPRECQLEGTVTSSHKETYEEREVTTHFTILCLERLILSARCTYWLWQSQSSVTTWTCRESDLLFSPSVLTTLRLQIDIQATNVRKNYGYCISTNWKIGSTTSSVLKTLRCIDSELQSQAYFFSHRTYEEIEGPEK